MTGSITKLAKGWWVGMLVMTFLTVSVFAQNKDLILRVEAGKGDCAQARIRFVIPSRVMNDQKVSFKITFNEGGNQTTAVGEGNLEKNKLMYSFLKLGPKGTFNGSIVIELTFSDNSTAISNEVHINQEGKWRNTCSELMTGNQMAADPDLPPPIPPKKPRITGTLNAQYQVSKGQQGKIVCPATATLTGAITLNEEGRESVYYRLLRWNAKSLDPLQPYYKVDLERYTPPKGNQTSTARVGSQINVLPPKASIIVTGWMIGEKEPLFSEGVVQLWRVIPGANNTFSYVDRLASVDLICGNSRGGSKGGDSGKGDAKTSSKPK